MIKIHEVSALAPSINCINIYFFILGFWSRAILVGWETNEFNKDPNLTKQLIEKETKPICN